MEQKRQEHESVREYIKVSLVFFVLIFIVFLGIRQCNTQQMLQELRALPTWVHLIFTLLVLIPVAIGFYVFFWIMPPAELEAKSLAEEISKHKWYVKGASVFERKIIKKLDSKGWQEIKSSGPERDEGAAIIELSTTDLKREKLILAIRPGHPSMEILKQLTYLDIVKFQFVKEPLLMALDSELCAYLIMEI